MRIENLQNENRKYAKSIENFHVLEYVQTWITWFPRCTWCVKKSNQHSGKMTEAIYLEVSEKTEAAKKAGRRVSVSGMLKFLGVSRSGYLAWLHHVPSDTEKRRKAVKAKIQDIYDDSKAPSWHSPTT